MDLELALALALVTFAIGSLIGYALGVQNRRNL